MMRERDIRQETFEEYKDSKQSKLVTFSALTTGVGMLAAFGFGQFSFFFGSAIGLVFIIVICLYIYVFRKKCKKRRDLIMRGYRTFGAYISSKGTTEVYQCYPETNEWSYYLDEFGVTRTKDWRYDSQCSEPLELQYDFSFAFGARPNEVNTPRLLIPESYRDRLDEFIKDKDDTDKTLL